MPKIENPKDLRRMRRKRNVLAKEMRSSKIFHEKRIEVKPKRAKKITPREIMIDDEDDTDIPLPDMPMLRRELLP